MNNLSFTLSILIFFGFLMAGINAFKASPTSVGAWWDDTSRTFNQHVWRRNCAPLDFFCEEEGK
jgi:hypothetical protein